MPLKNLTLDFADHAASSRSATLFAKQRIMPETALYTIADLSTVWVIADVFEYEASADPRWAGRHA